MDFDNRFVIIFEEKYTWKHLLIDFFKCFGLVLMLVFISVMLLSF
ncbi:MAG TPA: hypothetical protein VMZ91_07720 [Candidatus Paceibacterota bacterium]|nr:hypothetical protein [Candidatus Paceibacterota bacterium]